MTRMICMDDSNLATQAARVMQDEQGRGMMEIALSVGHNEGLKRLLDAGHCPNKMFQTGDLPLHIAIRSSNIGAFMLLLQHPTTNLMACDTNRNTLLHHLMLSNSAFMVFEGVCEVLAERLSEEQQRDMMAAQNVLGSTALLVACKRSETCHLVPKLLEMGSSATTPDNDGFTPLHEVFKGQFPSAPAEPNREAAAAALVAKGAAVNAVASNNMSVLEAAIRTLKSEFLQVLADAPEIVNMHRKFSDGKLPLLSCVQNRRPLRLIEFLILHDSTLVSGYNTASIAVVAGAAHSQCWHDVDKLVKLGFDENCQDAEGCTALHYAASAGRADMVQFLLRFRHMRDVVRDKSERLAIHCAVAHKNLDAISALMEAHKENPTYINAASKDGTPLTICAANGDVRVLQRLLLFDMTRRSADCGVSTGSTWALHEAISAGSAECVEQLLSHRRHDTEYVNCRDGNGNTSLHVSVKLSNWEVTRLLLARGARLDAVNKKGDTIPCIAIGHATEEFYVRLHNHYKDCNALDVFSQAAADGRCGYTTKGLVVEGSKLELVRMLQAGQTVDPDALAATSKRGRGFDRKRSQFHYPPPRPTRLPAPASAECARYGGELHVEPGPVPFSFEQTPDQASKAPSFPAPFGFQPAPDQTPTAASSPAPSSASAPSKFPFWSASAAGVTHATTPSSMAPSGSSPFASSPFAGTSSSGPSGPATPPLFTFGLPTSPRVPQTAQPGASVCEPPTFPTTSASLSAFAPAPAPALASVSAGAFAPSPMPFAMTAPSR